MVMGYDFNWCGSARAGGVAPIDSPYALDVDTAMADYLELVPASKLIWGVPYYGRAWTTQSSAMNSLTCKSASVCPGGDAAAGAFGRSWASALRRRPIGGGDARPPLGRDRPGRRGTATRARPTTPGCRATTRMPVARREVRPRQRRTGCEASASGTCSWTPGARELWDTLGRNMLALPFTDIDDSIHWKSIVWIAEQGITSGCGSFHYCPDGQVTRGQMATFLVRGAEPALDRHRLLHR